MTAVDKQLRDLVLLEFMFYERNADDAKEKFISSIVC